MNVAQINPYMLQLSAPAPLQDIPGWVIWRYQAVPGSEKPGKIPYWANGTVRHGSQGGQADLDNLVTFAAAREAAAKRAFDGVGLAMLSQWGFVATDFDNCVDAQGKVDPVVLDLIAGTYAEISPSNRGIRAFFRGDLGNRKSPTKVGQFGFEVFSSSGFVTMTGNILPHVDLLGQHDTILPVSDKLRAYCEHRFGASAPGHDPDDFMAGYEPRLNLTVGKMKEILSHLDPDIGRDDWVKVGMALHHECEGDDTGFDLWNGWSSGGSKYPGEESLRVQWDSFTRRSGPGRKQTTMKTVIWLAKQAGYEVVKVASAEQVEQDMTRVEEGDQPGATPAGFRFPILRACDAEQRPMPTWFIKGALPEGDLGVIYGASGSGKTFVAFDVACALARGVDWRGRRTRQARCLIIAAEGSGGVAARIKAYRRQHDLRPEELSVSIMYAAPNFMDQEDITQVCQSIKAAGGFDIIFVDTFAQVTPGANENASEDMGRALANTRVLRDATGAMLVLIHHAGKDASRGSRGWSGIKGAADFQWEITRYENGDREILLEKVKDGEDGLRWGFRLDRVVLAMDADGDEITSCIVAETEFKADKPEPGKRVKRRNKIAGHILEMVEILGNDVQSVTVEKLVAMSADALPVPEGGRDTRRQQVLRALKDMGREKDGPIMIEGNIVIFCE